MKNLDERGHACPTPLVNTIGELKKMNIGDTLMVKVDNEMPLKNITKFANSNNLQVETKKISEKEYDITITKTNEISDKADVNSCSCNNGDGLVVVISSNMMGVGDETLGKNLIKAFIFAITKQDILPSKMLFYNKGAYLTTEGSESLEDLNNLKNAGVEILTCGTCLDFYNLKDKLKVGEVTNMYDIVKNMESASSIIKP